MNKELVMIKVNDSWDFIINISKTINKQVDTDLAVSIIEEHYKNRITYTLEIGDNEIYLISDEVIPCENCP
jgi:hypothetical protein